MSGKAPNHCNVCIEQAASNRSGKAKCDGKSPCSWCKKRGIDCTYVAEGNIENLEDGKPGESLPDAHLGLAAKDTTMTIVDKADGSRILRFDPDLENIGDIDATLASDFCLPEELPIDNYVALTTELKRKRVETLTRFECQRSPTHLAKRIRGGQDIDGDGGPDINNGVNAPGPPPVPPPQPDNMARLLEVMVASQAATQQFMVQMLEKIDGMPARKGVYLSSHQPRAVKFLHARSATRRRQIPL
jgi:hypothetical protein